MRRSKTAKPPLAAPRRKPFRIRTAMHVLATLGPGLSIMALPLVSSPALSVVLLCTALGCQAFNYVGAPAPLRRPRDS